MAEPDPNRHRFNLTLLTQALFFNRISKTQSDLLTDVIVRRKHGLPNLLWQGLVILAETL